MHQACNRMSSKSVKRLFAVPVLPLGGAITI